MVQRYLHITIFHFHLFCSVLLLYLLNSFISLIKDWLEENADYEVIVDGANIGLYQQNFAEGGFSLLQVVYPNDWLVLFCFLLLYLFQSPCLY